MTYREHSRAAALLDLYLEHAPDKPALAEKMHAMPEFRDAIALAAKALREVDEWDGLQRCAELVANEPEWMINEHIVHFKRFLEARARYKAGDTQRTSPPSFWDGVARWMRGIACIALLASCVTYEQDPPKHNRSWIVFVNDPYCDDSGARGWWCE